MDGTLGTDVGDVRSRPSHRPRIAAQSAIERLLVTHGAARRRSSAARLFGVPVLSDDMRARYAEVVDRQAVGAELDRLRDGWTVLNSLHIDGHDTEVDHLVVGPAGVFVVAVSVSDYAWGGADPLADRLAARRRLRTCASSVGEVERRLDASVAGPVRVTGVVVSLAPTAAAVVPPYPDLAVVPVGVLAEWFAALPPDLSPARAGAILAVAQDESTWTTRSSSTARGTELLVAFAGLRAQVESARVIRRRWSIGLAASFTALTVTALLGVLAQAGVLV